METIFNHQIAHIDYESEDASLLLDILNCRDCSLREGCNKPVPGTQLITQGLMIVGEAPGEQEDLQGTPFVGRSGQLLTESLSKIGLNREDVFITNIVKCRPPNNRDPLPEEVAACRKHLERQIATARPKLIIALGRIAASHLLGRQVRITKEHGMVDVLPFNENVLVSIIYHPSYILRNRNTQIEKDFLNDLLEARNIVYGTIAHSEVFKKSTG